MNINLKKTQYNSLFEGLLLTIGGIDGLGYAILMFCFFCFNIISLKESDITTIQLVLLIVAIVAVITVVSGYIKYKKYSSIDMDSEFDGIFKS
jgi:hypothetical protein